MFFRPWNRLAILVFAVLSSAFLSDTAEGMEQPPVLEMTAFSTEITPTAGQPVGSGFIPVLATVEHPLLARGVLLRSGDTVVALCTLDWMEVHNESYELLRKTIAEAAGTKTGQVAVHAIHQHTAPAIDIAAQRLQLSAGDPRRIATSRYFDEVRKRLAKAVRESRKSWRPVRRIGVGRATVKRVASNRRLAQADGSIQGRSSSTKSAPELRGLPEGLIDPWVRSVSFDGSDGPIAQFHYFASHPQSFYGDGRTSYDVPGIVRQRLEKDTGVFQLYFTGCGGDVAFGKYNDGSRKARAELVDRLHNGIRRSIASLKTQPAGQLSWATKAIRLPLRTDAAFRETVNRRILANKEALFRHRLKASIALAWIERQARQPVELSCLTIGRVKLLHLPGEPFVQYQLAAQRMLPDWHVCVAGYGDCGMGYIGGDRIFTDRGGYEQTYSFAGPCEKQFTKAIKEVLRARIGGSGQR